MSKVIKIRKGLNIPLLGEASRKILKAPHPDTVAIKPPDYKGLTLKLNVKAEQYVNVGTALLFDKSNPQILITSPVSGIVKSINRGERRKITEVIIESDGKNTQEEFEGINRSSLTPDLIIEHLLKTGLWVNITQRPFGIVADPTRKPRAIFVSCFDSSPLAPDLSYILEQDKESFVHGLEIIKQLTTGKVYLGIDANKPGIFESITGVEKHYFSGPHPAGNVGVQIHHISPIGKGDMVWTLRVQDIQNIGRYFTTSKLDFERLIAITGSEVLEPIYVKTVVGTSFTPILKGNVTTDKKLRYISGNPLTGTHEMTSGYLGYNHDQITVIPEGDEYEFVGWALPRFKKFSASNTYFSWMFPKRKYIADANMHGDPRAFVVTGEYEKYLPMDILPVFLLKSIITNDIDQMEQLGIYELIEEDLALCEYVCTSKTEVQKILREGIDVMITELK
ncbi:MAG: Na(+)-translocating NADH-quinone reductase subunit A [Salinivirgaceae bacterium]|nr:Na(+)-translocating NADH-quinone reductase subunit A [Salinivirgaceae bacterium]